MEVEEGTWLADEEDGDDDEEEMETELVDVDWGSFGTTQR